MFLTQDARVMHRLVSIPYFSTLVRPVVQPNVKPRSKTLPGKLKTRFATGHLRVRTVTLQAEILIPFQVIYQGIPSSPARPLAQGTRSCEQESLRRERTSVKRPLAIAVPV